MKRLIALVYVVVSSLAATPVGAAPFKGDGPTTIQTGYGSVWVGTGGGWEGGGFVVRIDPRRHRIVGRIRVYGFVHGLVPAYGSIWIASGTAVLQRLDARTGRVQEIWSRENWDVSSVAVASGRLWVLDAEAHRLWGIDARRNKIVERVDLGAVEPLSLWAGGARLWLGVNSDPKPPMVEDDLEHVRLVALDPATALPSGPAIETAGWVAFAPGFGSLWASDPLGGSLTRIDSSSGRPIVSISTAQAGFAPLAAFGALWLPTGPTLERLDPGTLSTSAGIPVRASAVAAGSGALWALSTIYGAGGAVTKIDPQTNRVVGPPIRIVTNP